MSLCEGLGACSTPHTMNKIKGYTTIQIGGQQRPLKFGTNQAKIYQDLRGITHPQYVEQLTTLEQTGDPSVIRDVVYSALVAGARTDKKEVDFDEHQVGDWLDAVEPEELSKAFEVMVGSNGPNEKAPTLEVQGQS